MLLCCYCIFTVMLLCCYFGVTVLLLYIYWTSCHCFVTVLLLSCYLLLLRCYCRVTVLLLCCYCIITVFILPCYCIVTGLLSLSFSIYGFFFPLISISSIFPSFGLISNIATLYLHAMTSYYSHLFSTFNLYPVSSCCLRNHFHYLHVYTLINLIKLTSLPSPTFLSVCDICYLRYNYLFISFQKPLRLSY